MDDYTFEKNWDKPICRRKKVHLEFDFFGIDEESIDEYSFSKEKSINKEEAMKKTIKVRKKENNDKEMITLLLNSPIDKYEFDNLYIELMNVVNIVNLDRINKLSKYNKFYTEILDDEDKLYKKVTINLEEKTISIDLCQTIDQNYFIAKNITYYNESDIQFCKKLVKQENFIELAIKKWQYNGQGINIQCFKEIENVDYTKTIPCCSISELRDTKNHYKRCLTKNKKIHNNVEN